MPNSSNKNDVADEKAGWGGGNSEPRGTGYVAGAKTTPDGGTGYVAGAKTTPDGGTGYVADYWWPRDNPIPSNPEIYEDIPHKNECSDFTYVNSEEYDNVSHDNDLLGNQVSSLDGKIKQLLPTLPEDYDGRVSVLAGLNAATRSVIAAELAPALNARIKSMPHDTLDQKKELARWVNDQLESLGLAIREPKTGFPGKLRGIAGGYKPGEEEKKGSFCIEVRRNGKDVKSAYSNSVFELTLIDAVPQQESEATWQQDVGAKESRSGRKRS